MYLTVVVITGGHDLLSKGCYIMQKLINLKTKIAAARAERGATDPILVIAAIAVSLVLLVGGSFAVSGIITNGHNLNAKSDLDKISVAQVAYYAERDAYVAYEKNSATAALTALEDGGVGFTPTEGGDLHVLLNLGTSDWAAISESASTDANLYVKTSESNAIVEVTRTGAVVANQTATLADLGIAQADVVALVAALA